MVSSNAQTLVSVKLPIEALFIDWQDTFAYKYRTENMDGLGASNGIELKAGQQKGFCHLAQCNLAHRMIAKGFSLKKTVAFLLENLTLQNTYKQEKNLPVSMFILNRNPDFNKGINKILKMVVMMPESVEQICQFI